jgi:hypothetical protein
MSSNNITKKMLLVILLFLGVVSSFEITFVNASDDVFVPSYSVNAPEMTEDELLEYYIENGIHPSTPPTGTTDRIEGESSVEPHLISRFPEYTSCKCGIRK